jgi:hypothetical protein
MPILATRRPVCSCGRPASIFCFGTVSLQVLDLSSIKINEAIPYHVLGVLTHQTLRQREQPA